MIQPTNKENTHQHTLFQLYHVQINYFFWKKLKMVFVPVGGAGVLFLSAGFFVFFSTEDVLDKLGVERDAVCDGAGVAGD